MKKTEKKRIFEKNKIKMAEIENLDFDILEIYERFSLLDNENCSHLSEWLNQDIVLDEP